MPALVEYEYDANDRLITEARIASIAGLRSLVDPGMRRVALLEYIDTTPVPLFYEQCPPATIGLLGDSESDVGFTLTIKLVAGFFTFTSASHFS